MNFCLCGCKQVVNNKFVKGHNNTGKKLTEEWRQKIKAKRALQIISKETCQKISLANKGRKVWNKNVKGYSTKLKGKSKYSYINLNQMIYCQCGCGKQIKLEEKYRDMYGRRGFPKYMHGHNRKGTEPKNKGKKGIYKHSLKIKETIAKSKVGWCSPFKGIARTIEVRKKIAESNTGKILSNKTKEKIREARLLQIIPYKDTSIEVALQEALRKEHIEFETHKALFGQPDIFIKPKLCIFADGDYWHANPSKYIQDSVIFKKNGIIAKRVWDKDAKVTAVLEKNGYKVLRFWESDIKNNLTNCINIIKNRIVNVQ